MSDTHEMTLDELKTLERLLRQFRDMAMDREEWEKRESTRFDAEFELGCYHDVRDKQEHP